MCGRQLCAGNSSFYGYLPASPALMLWQRFILCLQCSSVAAALSEDTVCSHLLLQGRSWRGWMGRGARGHSPCCGYSAGKSPKTVLLEFFESLNASVGNPISPQDGPSLPRWWQSWCSGVSRGSSQTPQTCPVVLPDHYGECRFRCCSLP